MLYGVVCTGKLTFFLMWCLALYTRFPESSPCGFLSFFHDLELGDVWELGSLRKYEEKHEFINYWTVL